MAGGVVGGRLDERRAGMEGQRALAALLGTTRAQVLLYVAAGSDVTATDLVRRLGVSAATVSHHTTVLRNSGLITTRRVGGSVRHALTLSGRGLLNAHIVPSH